MSDTREMGEQGVQKTSAVRAWLRALRAEENRQYVESGEFEPEREARVMGDWTVSGTRWFYWRDDVQPAFEWKQPNWRVIFGSEP